MDKAITAIIGGVDAHEQTHHAVALDERGRRLGDEAFPTTRTGYQQLLVWFRQFGPIQSIGIESTGAYAAGLTRFLRAADINVIEVNQPHPHTRHRRDKTDAIDAEAAAQGAIRRSSHDPEGNDRNRRVDPSTPCGAR